MKTVKANGVKDQAVIVITQMQDGTMLISSKNNGRSAVSKMADAIVKLAGAVIENPPKLPSISPSPPAETGGKS